MKCILSKSTNPYFHLAAEEYLLRNSKDEFCIIWKSKPVVVVGKHQNALAEINYRFIRENGIRVARRLTGGGTVFHDEGNINFTFIKNGEPGKLVDFKKHVSPVIEFLRKLNIEATLGKKNELLMQGLKISGNAEHVFKNRILHHGTLLFSADLSKLEDAIHVQPHIYSDKAVKSNRSEITNLNCCLPPVYSAGRFMSELFEFLSRGEKNEIVDLSTEQEERVNQLIREKYESWEWIFGYSPKYSFKKTVSLINGDFNLSMDIIKGIISHITVSYNPWNCEFIKRFEKTLVNVKHDYDSISQVLLNIEGIESAITSRTLEIFF